MRTRVLLNSARMQRDVLRHKPRVAVMLWRDAASWPHACSVAQQCAWGGAGGGGADNWGCHAAHPHMPMHLQDIGLRREFVFVVKSCRR